MGLSLGGILSGVQAASKVVGRVTGLLGTQKDGAPVKARKTRLAASVTALIVALLSWAGVPEPVAQAAADVAVELGLMAAQ